MHRQNHTNLTKGEHQSSGAILINKKSEVSVKKPHEDVLSMLMFFRPPPPSYPHVRSLTAEDQLAEQVDDFRFRLNDVSKHGLGSPHLTPGILEGNVQVALRFIQKNYSHKEPRRTGEPYDIHSDRIFLRGIQQLHHATNPDQAEAVATSLLARILHDEAESDSKESDKAFNITTPHPHDSQNRCYLSTKGIKGTYEIHLPKTQRNILMRQIEALTIPAELENRTDNNGETTERQINHLLAVAREIASEYGPLEAYLTLRAKIDDRIDNLLTYFEGRDSNKESTKGDLLKKLTSTKKYFSKVETEAAQYLDSYQAINPTKNSDFIRSLQATDLSVVEIADALQNAKSYDELFKQQINEAKKNQANSTKLGSFHKFLIPLQKSHHIQ
jgi:hypothetical protein